MISPGWLRAEIRRPLIDIGLARSAFHRRSNFPRSHRGRLFHALLYCGMSAIFISDHRLWDCVSLRQFACSSGDSSVQVTLPHARSATIPPPLPVPTADDLLDRRDRGGSLRRLPPHAERVAGSTHVDRCWRNGIDRAVFDQHRLYLRRQARAAEATGAATICSHSCIASPSRKTSSTRGYLNTTATTADRSCRSPVIQHSTAAMTEPPKPRWFQFNLRRIAPITAVDWRMTL
jgi:hypothetical protein